MTFITLIAVLFCLVMWYGMAEDKKEKEKVNSITHPHDFTKPPKVTIYSNTDYDTGYTTIDIEYPEKKPERKGKDDETN